MWSIYSMPDAFIELIEKHQILIQILQHVSLLLFLLCLLFLTTYFITRAQFEYAQRTEKENRKSPTLPYFIPFLGHAMWMASDALGLVSSVVSRYKGTPIRLRLFITDIYLITGSENIATIWKQAQHFHNKAYRALAVHNMFGMPKHALSFYLADNSGISLHPHPASDVPENDRIDFLTHTSMTKFLTGPGLKPVVEKFVVNLVGQTWSRDSIGLKWVCQADLLAFLQNELFLATVDAIFGSFILSANPELCQDFWDFDRAVPHLAKKFPRWLTPAPYRSRDKLLQSVKRWHSIVQSNRKEIDSSFADDDWNPYSGARVVIARQEMWSKMKPMDADAQASEDLGMIWGANANSVPAAFWALYEVVRDPALLSRVRAEVEDCLLSPPSVGLKFDLQNLFEQPLLQSIYAETLRLRVASFIVRTPERADFTLKDWRIPRGAVMTISSFHFQSDVEIWNSGGKENPHPLSEFWSDRFLVYPGDRSSGPRKTNENFQVENSLQDLSNEGVGKQKPTFSLNGLASAWIPYGGGNRICPGRYLAKQKIIATLAIMITLFDIELGEEAVSLGMDMRGFGFGALSPNAKCPFRIKRRM